MAPRGSSIVPIAGSSDKRQITGNLAVTLSGKLLPFQLIYEGKTNRCLPKGVQFPTGFHLTMTPNHWSNENTSKDYVLKILAPYIEKTKQELGLPPEQKSIIISDVFRGQQTQEVLTLYETLNIIVQKVPPNLTHIFQPLDVSINGLVKSHMRDQYEKYYATCITTQLAAGINQDNIDVDTRISKIKKLHAEWIIKDTYNFLSTRKDDIIKGFSKAGITDAASENFVSELDPFADLM